MEIANLIIRVVGEGLDEASRRLDELRARSRRAREETDVLSSSVRQLRQAALGLVGGIGIQSLIQTADAMKNLDSQVRLVTTSIEQFNAVQSRLREIANNQYSSIESLTELYTSSQRALSQLGKTQNETLDFTNNLAMAMRVGGGEAQAQAAALTQLGQALASGVLRGDEFNSIAEQAPILLRLISEELGVTQGKLRGLAADGKISAEVVYNAVANSTEALEAMAAQMPVTVGQALTVLRNNFKTFIGDTLNSTVGWTGAIASAIGVVAKHFDSIATILIGGAVLWGAYALAVSSVIPAVLALTAAMLLNPVFMLAAVLTASVIATEGLEGAIDSLADAFAVMGVLAVDALQWIGEGFSNLWDVTTDYISGLIENSEIGTKESAGAFAWMFDRTEGGFLGMLQIAANVFDKVGAVALAAALTIDKGIHNAGVAVQRVATGMRNALVDAFNRAARSITSTLNAIGQNINDKIKAFNSISPIDITYQAKTDWQPIQGEMSEMPNYIPNTVSGNYQQASTYMNVNGLRSKLDKAIYGVQYSKLRKENEAATASLDEMGNAAAKAAEELDKAGKKGAKAAKKTKDSTKDANKELNKQKKIAEDLKKAFDNMVASLSKSIFMTNNKTAVGEMAYDLQDANNKLSQLDDTGKEFLIGLAARKDLADFDKEHDKSMEAMRREIELLNAANDLEAEKIKLRHEYNDLLKPYEIFNDLGMGDVYNGIKGALNRQQNLDEWLVDARHSKQLNDQLIEGTDALYKQMEMVGQGGETALKSFLYDLNMTGKYVGANAEVLKEYEQALRNLESFQIAEKVREDLGSLKTELYDYMSGATEFDKNDYQLDNAMAKLTAGMEYSLIKQKEYDELKEIAKKQHYDRMVELDMQYASETLGSASSMFKDLFGEQSKAYRAMFAIEKGFAIATAIMNIQKALSSATASLPFPANLPVIASVAAQGASIISSIKSVMPKGFKSGGYTGSIGTNNVAGVVHGNEYVFDAQSTKAIGVENLERIRRGKGTGEVNITVNNHSSAKIETETDSQGNIIMTIRDEVKRSWSNLQNPNSHESKMLGRNVQAPRRR